MTSRVITGEAGDVLRSLGAFDLIITDPPYAGGSARREWKVTAHVAIALREATRHLAPGGAMLVFAASSGRGLDFTLSSVDLRLSRQLTWAKRFVRSPAAGPWRWDTVPILVFGRGVFGRPQFSSLCLTDGPVPGMKERTGHPAEVPAAVAEWLTRPFDAGKPLRVLDPFCGSGSLLLPSARRGWDVTGIDIDPKWATLARTRLEEQACLTPNLSPSPSTPS